MSSERRFLRPDVNLASDKDFCIRRAFSVRSSLASGTRRAPDPFSQGGEADEAALGIAAAEASG